MAVLGRERKIRWWLACLLCAALSLGVLAHTAAPEPAGEYQVKAAFLLNFTKFIEWPADAFEGPASPFAICILGDDPFGASLNRLVEGEEANGRKLVVQRLRRAPAPKACQLLFVGREERDVTRMLAGLGPGVLTVGEADRFLHEGGIIAFVLEDRRVRFDINQTAAANASLAMSARLLNVARSVRK
jgi:hypothetical protein